MNIDMKYVEDFMLEILAIPSPAGDTTVCMDRVNEEFKSMNISTTFTNKGALIATIEGEDSENQKTIAAHIDTIGAMVKEIKDNGRLKLAQIGGFGWGSLEGENVIVKTRKGKRYTGSILPVKASVHIYRQDAKEGPRQDEDMEVRLDKRIETKEHVLELGIGRGDFLYIEPRPIITEDGFYKSRYLDDKSAVAVVMGMCKYIVDNNIKLKYTTNFFISNYEEVGHGVTAIPKKTKEFIAIDIGTVGEGQASDEYSVSIAARDAFGPYNFELRNKLVDIAEKHDISYKVDLYNGYGSDASAVVHQGFDVNYACVGPGVDATHHYERTHREAVENNIKLLMHYITE